MIRNFAIAAGLAFAFATPSFALTQIMSPTDEYRNDTFLIGVPGNGDPRDMWGDMDLTVFFSTPLQPRTVGVNWATWGTLPDVEQEKPRIWFSQGETQVTLTFSQAVSTWGFEALPNPFEDVLFEVEYFSGMTSLGTISRTINGDNQARLLAAVADFGTSFDRVVITAGSDFAIAQLRYELASGVIPEPATWAMLITGFGMVGFAMRRRRTIGSVNA